MAPWGRVYLRELDAETRVQALARYEAAREQHGLYNVLTNTVLWAYVIRHGLLDEAGGRPLFNDDDLPTLEKQRPAAIQALGERIWALSEATPEATKSGDPAADAGQLDT